MDYTDQNRNKLAAQIKRSEGTKTNKQGEHVAYLDTEGILTVGYGHNCIASPVPSVTKPGDTISQAKADQLFEADLNTTIDETLSALPWVADLNPPRQAVIFAMAFNLGLPRLLKFKRTLGAAQAKLFVTASKEMLDSTWAKQVGNRAKRLSVQMRDGDWQIS